MRDFKSFRLYWGLLTMLTLVALVLTNLSPNTSMLISFVQAYGYFLFAMAPISHIMGSWIRSQHTMSRAYLLALPIERTALYRIQLLRMAVFSAPLAIYQLVSPHQFAIMRHLQSWHSVDNPILLSKLAAIPVYAWWVTAALHFHLVNERTMSEVSSPRRTWLFIRNFFFSVGEMNLALFALIPLWGWLSGTLLLVLIMLSAAHYAWGLARWRRMD